MSIEDEVFKKQRINFNKLEKYGFIKENEIYKFEKEFMDGSFVAKIEIDKNAKVTGKVIDIAFDEEYTNFRVEDVTGEFVNTVKAGYIKILEDIRKNCFETQYFIYNQSNRITALIKEKYGDEPEYTWEDKFKDYGTFRNPETKKWYALIMNVAVNKIEDAEGKKINGEKEVEVINVKIDDEKIKHLFEIKAKGIYRAYHMNKQKWISIILDIL